ncbi:MAG: class I SAM-dependent methyltransferase, partial [Chitinophagaceae bacterium]
MMMISPAFNPSITQSNYLIRHRLLKAISRFAPNLKGKLLDFGCGQKPYYSLFTVDEYIGIDFENPGHPHANEAIDVFYNGKNIPFANNTFDSIFTSEVFEHVFNLPEIITELHRVLKPGGQLLISCPFAFCEHEQPNDYARYTSFAMRHMLQQKGFEVIEQVKTGNSIEAIYQLRLVYIHQHITPKVRKIPVVRSLFRLFIYTTYNLTA